MSGFSFKNYFRNKVLEEKNIKVPNCYETGTTISGIIFEDGVVLGADTRSTSQAMIVDGNCKKIHYLADNIFCCGAGVVADIENLVQLMSTNSQLLSLNSGRDPLVCSFVRMMRHHLHRYQGFVTASLIIGGVDATGPHLVSVYPHGSSDALPFASMGSGGYAAMAVLEANYRPNMTQIEAEDLVRDSIKAGVDNDLGSGAAIDICVMKLDSVNQYQEISTTVETFSEEVYARGPSQAEYSFKPGSSIIVTEEVKML